MDNNQEKCGICRVKDLCPLNTFVSWFEKAQVHVVLNTKFCAYFEPIQIDPVSIEKAKEQKPETCQNCEHFERKIENDKPKVRGYAKEADARKLKQIVRGIGEICKLHNCPDCPLFPLHAETNGKACDFFFREPINPKGNQ